MLSFSQGWGGIWLCWVGCTHISTDSSYHINISAIRSWPSGLISLGRALAFSFILFFNCILIFQLVFFKVLDYNNIFQEFVWTLMEAAPVICLMFPFASSSSDGGAKQCNENQNVSMAVISLLPFDMC